MSLNDDLLTLNELGLSFTEAKIYLTLLKNGILAAKEIAQSSSVARPHIYEALEKLMEKGLVTRILTTPETFEPIPFEECISTLMQRRLTKTAELQEKTLTMMKKNIYQTFVSGQKAGIDFKIIPKKDSLYKKSEKMINETSECICLLGTKRKLLYWISTYFDRFEAADTRGVHLRLILPTPNYQDDNSLLSKLSKLKFFKLRFFEQEPIVSFGVFDKKEVLLSQSIVDIPGRYPALWSDNKSLVDLVQAYFEFAWTASK